MRILRPLITPGLASTAAAMPSASISSKLSKSARRPVVWANVPTLTKTITRVRALGRM